MDFLIPLAEVTDDGLKSIALGIGAGLGSIGAGALADRVGRRAALSVTVVFFGVFSLASVFSWDVVSLGVFRFLTSAGLAAMTVVAVIYVSELFPAARRGKYQAYAIAIGICGTPATSLIASAVVPMSDWSWRLVYLWGALGLFFVFFLGRLKESPRWLESRGDHERAEAVLRDIEVKRATAFPGVPRMWIALANDPSLESRDLSSLVAAGSGGAPLPVEVAKVFERKTGLTL